jgi:A/G-specific adenine glycosylase
MTPAGIVGPMDAPTTVPGPARDAILEWYGRAGRRLAFRATSDPFAVLVSEAMAQQTQAARAGEAWTRFLAAFPTVAALASASPADVLRAWHGLGYNRRALNLWRAAQVIVTVHGGRVPSDLGALEALPGVGPYTARAVAAIAFGVRVGAVDTNVRRVLGRVTAGDAGALVRTVVKSVADAAVPPGRSADWTHAVMDLGATICLPRRPACGACPVRTWCRYAARASQGARAPVVPPPRRRTTPSTPFPSTTRWLRGRIVDRLRTATADGWSLVEAPIGSHDDAAVRAALDALAREGLVEVDRTSQPGRQLARLPVA